jgi:hypothetical protein
VAIVVTVADVGVGVGDDSASRAAKISRTGHPITGYVMSAGGREGMEPLQDVRVRANFTITSQRSNQGANNGRITNAQKKKECMF